MTSPWKLPHQAVEIIVIVGDVHIGLGKEDGGIRIPHLEDPVEIGHIVGPGHRKADIHRDQQQDQDHK